MCADSTWSGEGELRLRCDHGLSNTAADVNTLRALRSLASAELRALSAVRHSPLLYHSDELNLLGEWECDTEMRDAGGRKSGVADA